MTLSFYRFTRSAAAFSHFPRNYPNSNFHFENTFLFTKNHYTINFTIFVVCRLRKPSVTAYFYSTQKFIEDTLLLICTAYSMYSGIYWPYGGSGASVPGPTPKGAMRAHR